MEIIENMYYGIGKVALAIALADGKLDLTEVDALEDHIAEIGDKTNYNIDTIVTSFRINSKDDSIDSQTLLKSGIESFHLGDLHLNTELANIFLEVLNKVARAKSANRFAKDDVLVSFMSYLKDRANLAKYRELGYLKDVLILVDLKEISENLLARISELEDWLKSGFRLTLLHCISPEDLGGESFPKKKAEAEKQLTDLVNQHFDKKKSKGQILIEVINQRLEYIDQKYLDEKDVDFVIMPTSGKQRDDYFHTTKTSEHIQRHFANYLVIPDAVTIKSLSNILVVTDYSFTSIDQFEPLLELCKTTDSLVTLLCVGKSRKLSTRATEKKEALESYFGEHFNTSIIQTINEGIYEDILNFGKKGDFDLFVALPLHTSFFSTFDGHLSIVKKLCQYTDIPLLVLNKHPKRLPMEKIIEDRIVKDLDF